MAEVSPPEEESLVDLLNRATNPSNREDDVAAIEAFVEKIRNEKDGPQLSVRLLAHKIQSPQEREALQGLAVLDVCVQKCDSRFHQEIGKFRFLNEMIKIVSPKYLGNLTTDNVKQKTARLMFSWTKSLTAEPKISEAYNMLKRQGIISEDPVASEEAAEEAPPPPPPREDTLFKDEEKQKLLQRLLRSKNPEDHQAANRLIKNIVKEEEERREKGLKRMSELEKVNNNVKLLQEMIDAFMVDQSNSNADRELMKELFEECERLRPNLFKLASDADDKDESIADILKANDNLVKVLEAYHGVVAAGGGGGVVKLLDVSEGETGTDAAAPSAAADLLSDDLQSLGLDSPSTVMNAVQPLASEQPPAASDAAKDLASIFKTDEKIAPPTPPSGDLGGLLLIPPTGAASTVASPAPPSSTQPFPSDTDSASAVFSQSVANANGSASSSSAPIPSNAAADWSSFSKVFSSLDPAAVTRPEATPGAPPTGDTAPKPPDDSSVDIFESLKAAEPTTATVAMNGPSGVLLDAELDVGSSTVGANDAPLLQPKSTSTLPVSATSSIPSSSKETSAPASSKESKGFEDINLISRGLMEDTMKEFGVTKKAPLGTLDGSAASSTATTKMTLAELQKRKEEEARLKLQQHQQSSTNPLPIPGEGDGKLASPPTATSSPASSTIPTTPSSASLDDVTVKLEAVQPSTTLTPLSLYDQHGLKVLLFFAQDSCYPSPDVAVAILTTMSTNTLPLKAYKFQATAGKLTPVKLEAPTAKELPPFNPVLPPSAISQILLVANPNREPVKLNFELSFTLGETSYSDLGESQVFPPTVFP